jgi:5-methylcytosine-specific restriction endonuclease McrA
MHRKMLPQFSALQGPPGDNPGVGTKPGGSGATPTSLSPFEGSDPKGSVTRPVRADYQEIELSVFVLDRHKKPLMPCSQKRARLMLERGRARVHRLHPFTVRLVDRVVADSVLQPIAVKLDPGSKTTGIAAVREGGAVLFLGELQHRGKQISEALTARRAMRRRRRGNLRYRPARFNNRTKPKGWLAPSLQHRVDTVSSWVARLRRALPVTSIATELVRFDMQLLENPDISGVGYQQGTLAGYELREFLLNKWDRACAYCGVVNVPLQIEHIVCKARGGSNRESNLTLACQPCNQEKGAQPVEVFLAGRPAVLARIKATAKRPLKDAAAVNATRWSLFNRLKQTGLPVTTGSGGRTKWNRSRLGIPKTHALDAACVGEVDALSGWGVPSLSIKATGRGSYCRTNLDRFGFPRGYLTRRKRIKGFQTGDMVRAIIEKGKHAGTWVGRIAVRATGSFKLHAAGRVLDGISHRHCTVTSRADGYSFALSRELLSLPMPKGRGFSEKIR